MTYRQVESKKLIRQRLSWAARAVITLLSVLVAVSTAAADEPFSAGFINLPASSSSPPMGIWYPSTDVETAGKLRAFRPTWAWDGAIADGIFPVVILSHGNSGHFSSHRHTAATLARNGYIIAAPAHLSDPQMTSSSKFAPVIGVRVEELKHALSVVNAHPLIGKHTDTTRIGALGYSLGTLTLLYATGAQPELSRFSEHCRSHRKEDANFCGGGGWMSIFLTPVISVLSWLKEKGILKPNEKNRVDRTKEFPRIEPPINFSAIALVAPVGAPFSTETIHQQNADIGLFRLGDDAQLHYPWHAEYLHKSLNEKSHIYKTYPGVHHYAFISPFPQWLLDEEDIPVAIDPESFDRADFIRNINADLVDFFKQHL